MQTIAVPRGDTSTYLVHLFGSGLDADDRYVAERFRARADGEIVPVVAAGTRDRRCRKRHEALPSKAVEKTTSGAPRPAATPLRHANSEPPPRW